MIVARRQHVAIALCLVIAACSGGPRDKIAYRLLVDRQSGTLTFKCIASGTQKCLLRLSGGRGPAETAVVSGASVILSGPRAGDRYCVAGASDGDCPQAILREGRQVVRRTTTY